jgi:hypothetical protein
MPIHQRRQESAHIRAEPRRFVAAPVRLIAHEGGHVLGVVLQQARRVVLVGQVPGDSRVQGPDEVHAQTPLRVRRRVSSQVAGRLDVDRPTLLRSLGLRRRQIQGKLGLLLREGAALDAVGAEDASDHDLPLQPVGDLGQGGVVQALVGVPHAQQQGLYLGRIHSHLEGEGAEAGRLDPQRVLRQRKRHGRCPEKCPPRALRNDISSLALLQMLGIRRPPKYPQKAWLPRGAPPGTAARSGRS